MISLASFSTRAAMHSFPEAVAFPASWARAGKGRPPTGCATRCRPMVRAGSHPAAHAATALSGLSRDVPPDAIVVLGGGLLADGGLPPWVTRRLDTALDLFQHHGQSCPILCLGKQGYESASARACFVQLQPPCAAIHTLQVGHCCDDASQAMAMYDCEQLIFILLMQVMVMYDCQKLNVIVFMQVMAMYNCEQLNVRLKMTQ